MLLVDETYSRAVKVLVDSGEAVDMAIAFWGRGAEDVLASSTGGKRRILCNLVSGGTNPKVIRALGKHTGIDIRQDDTLHAKVLLGADYGIVGSANFSANGLGFESDERGHWIEAGYLVRDPEHLQDARQWFEKLWKKAKPITEATLAKAEEQWRRNRSRRPKPKGNLFDIHAGSWRDYLQRDIQLIVWRNRPDTEESARTRKDKAQRERVTAEASASIKERGLSLDYYHGWARAELSDLAATYIDVHYQRNGKVTCYGARRPLANGHVTWSAGDGGGSMDVMEKVRDIDDQRFGENQRRAFAAWLQPTLHQHFQEWLEEQNKELDTGGLVLRLDKVLEAAFHAEAGMNTDDAQFDWLLRCCEMVSDKLGLRCVKVDTAVPQARIGLGERSLSWKDQQALKRVSMLMWISGPAVICGCFLPKNKAREFGQLVNRQGKAGRSWIQWPIEETARILPKLVVAATPPFMARTGVHPSDEFTRKWPSRDKASAIMLPPLVTEDNYFSDGRRLCWPHPPEGVDDATA